MAGSTSKRGLAESRAPSGRDQTKSPSRTGKRQKTVDSDEEEAPAGQTLVFKNKDYFAKVEQKRKKPKSAKQILELPSSAPYIALAAAPSVIPRAKYCDVTGLPANYHDPNTGLRYYNAAVYQHIQGLSPSAVQALLQLRRAGVIL